MNKVFVLCAFVLFSCTVFLSKVQADIWYVDNDNTCNSSCGTSWATAFSSIQDAVDSAADSDEIWVKQGVYALGAEIAVDKVVYLYGGFDGTETQAEQRDWLNNITIIDGQNNVRCLYITADATIEGFTIIRGYASSYGGGGIYNYNADSNITDCIFIENTTERHGGGIHNSLSDPTITGCTFSRNTAVYWGGGISNDGCNFDGLGLSITDCTFSENHAGYDGGGIHNDTCEYTISGCTFLKNTAGYGGGGVQCTISTASDTIITDCTFIGNSALGDYIGQGGGAIGNESVEAFITNCTFIGNSAELHGGAILGLDSLTTITNCTFFENSAGGLGSGVANHDTGYTSGTHDAIVTNCILWGDQRQLFSMLSDTDGGILQLTASYCDVQGGYSGTGNISALPIFLRSPNPGADGVWGSEDDDYGDLHLHASSPCVDAGTSDDAPETDREGNLRWDIPDTPNTGGGIYPYYDMGAYECLTINHILTPPLNTNVSPGDDLGPYFSIFINNTNDIYEFYVDQYFVLPDGFTVNRPQSLETILAGQILNRARNWTIPVFVAPGTVTLGVLLTDIEGNVISDNSFDVSVVSGSASVGQ